LKASRCLRREVIEIRGKGNKKRGRGRTTGGLIEPLNERKGLLVNTPILNWQGKKKNQSESESFQKKIDGIHQKNKGKGRGFFERKLQLKGDYVKETIG